VPHHKLTLIIIDAFLLISQFLRLAAIRRGQGEDETDPNAPENLALEGILAKLYGGDEAAVEAMTNIILGSDVQAVSIGGEIVSTTCMDFLEYSVAGLTLL